MMVPQIKKEEKLYDRYESSELILIIQRLRKKLEDAEFALKICAAYNSPSATMGYFQKWKTKKA